MESTRKLVVLLVIAVSLFVLGCVGTSSTPTPTPAPTFNPMGDVWPNPPQTSTPQTGSLVGKVTSGGAPIGGARVIVCDPTGTLTNTTTAGDGTFSTPLGDHGTYMVRVTKNGYKASPQFCEYADIEPVVEINMIKG